MKLLAIAILDSAILLTGCAPKPRVSIRPCVGDPNSKYVHLDCPKGWIGNAEWHTIMGLSFEDQLAQYLKDAKQGRCERIGSNPQEVRQDRRKS